MAQQTVPRPEDLSADDRACSAWRWASCSSGRWRLLAQLNIDQFAFEGGAEDQRASLAAVGGADRRRRPRQRAGRHLVRRQSRAGNPAARGRWAGLVFLLALYRRRRVVRPQRGATPSSYIAACALLVAARRQLPACSTCRSRRSCSTTARPNIAARSWPPAISSPSAACCSPPSSIGCSAYSAVGIELYAAANLPALRPGDHSRLHLHRRADPAGDDPIPRLAAHAHVLPRPRLPPREPARRRRRAARAQPHLLARRPAAVHHLAAAGAHDRHAQPADQLVDARPRPRSWARIPIRTTPKAVRARHRHRPRGAATTASWSASSPKAASPAAASCRRSSPACCEISSGTDAPVVPVYLDELWGSIFSFRGGKFFWKWPSAGPPPRVDLVRPADRTARQTSTTVRQAVQELGAEAVTERKQRIDGAAPHDDPQVPQGDVPLEDRRLERQSSSPAASC